jgi:hypothetical protein
MAMQFLTDKKSHLLLGINADYKYFTATEIPSSVKARLSKSKSLLTPIDGILIPTTAVNSGALPLSGKSNFAISKIAQGCNPHEIEGELSREDFNRLCCAGFIKGELDHEPIYGAAIALASHNQDEIKDAINSHLKTDTLSQAALNHIERLNLADPLEIQAALYLFNHYGIFNTAPLNAAVASLSQFLSAGVSGFVEVPPPKNNPEWHFFYSDKSKKTEQKTEQDFKVYISPAIAATKECLRILKEVLPQIRIQTWKIGRGHLGLSRPDKICLYFNTQSSLSDGVSTLKRELSGIEAHGVPFTFRHDPAGLISSGADIPRNQSESHAALSGSWRVWISSRLAMAVHLNRKNKKQLLSTAEAALLSMKYLGIDPANWAITDSNFWRH